MKFKTIGCFICLVALSSAIYAQGKKGPHDSAIKARQGLMQVYGHSIGILSGMAKGKIDYDADAAAVAASNLLAAASLNQSAMWPAGSDNENPANAENRALPAIWSTYPKVADAGQALVDAAVELNSVASRGLDSLKGAIGPVGKSCKGCHDDFRAKKE